VNGIPKNHAHEHGHRHEHARKRSINLGWVNIELESHMHDQASTVSATLCAQADSGRTFEALVGALRTVAHASELAGGIVGHVKGYARAGESFVHASVTDAQHAPACEGDAQLPLNLDTQIQLVAIVLLIDQSELECIVVKALEAL